MSDHPVPAIVVGGGCNRWMVPPLAPESRADSQKQGCTRRLGDNCDAQPPQDLGGLAAKWTSDMNDRAQPAAAQLAGEGRSPQPGVHAIHVAVVVPIALRPELPASAAELS